MGMEVKEREMIHTHIQPHKIICNNKEDEEVGELTLRVNSTQAPS
jgi:hypothetical protein